MQQMRILKNILLMGIILYEQSYSHDGHSHNHAERININLDMLSKVKNMGKGDIKYSDSQNMGQIAYFVERCPQGYIELSFFYDSNQLSSSNLKFVKVNGTGMYSYHDSSQVATGNVQGNGVNKKIVSCILMEDQNMESIGQANEMVNRQIIGLTVGLVILLILGIVIMLMVCKKSSVVASDEQLEEIQVQEEDTQKMNEEEGDVSEQGLQQRVNELAQNAQKRNQTDQQLQKQINELKQSRDRLKAEVERCREFQLDVLDAKQEELELKQTELEDNFEIMEKKQVAIEKKQNEMEEQQDEIVQKINKIKEQPVEKSIDDMSLEELQALLISKKNLKKQRQKKFISDLEKMIYDAINEKKIFWNKEKEIVRVNSFTQVYSQFVSAFGQIDLNNDMKRGCKAFIDDVKNLNDRRFNKIQISKERSGEINLQATSKKYVLAIESRAKDYFDILRRIIKNFDISLIGQLKESTQLLMRSQEVMVKFNDSCNLMSNNDLFDDVMAWFKYLIELIELYEQQSEGMQQEIDQISAKIEAVKKQGVGI